MNFGKKVFFRKFFEMFLKSWYAMRVRKKETSNVGYPFIEWESFSGISNWPVYICC